MTLEVEAEPVVSDAELRAAMDDTELATRRVFAQRCRAVGEAEARKLWKGRHLSIHQMVHADYGWSNGDRQRTFAVARAGRAHPRLLDALEAGALSVDQTVVLARAILNSDVCTLDTFAVDLECWLNQGDRDYADFKLAVDEWVAACTPEPPPEPHKDHASMKIRPDGTRRFEATFGPESGEEFAEVLGELANAVFLSDWRDGKAIHGDDMNFGLLARDDAERLAHALLLMARQAAGSDHDGTTDPGVIVVIDERTFLDELTRTLNPDNNDASPDETREQLRELLHQLLDHLDQTIDTINHPPPPDTEDPAPEKPAATEPEPEAPAAEDPAPEEPEQPEPDEPGQRLPPWANLYDWNVIPFGEPATTSQPPDPPLLPTQRHCRTAGGIPISPARAVTAAVVGWVRFLMVDELGNPLATSSKQRCFKGVTRQLIKAINPTCIWPGCRQPAQICQIDHIVEHHQGGPTNLINGGLECGRHNRLKHLTGIVPRRDHRGIWQLYDAHTNTIINTDVLLM